MYLPLRELVDIVLPELSDAFMSKHMGLTTEIRIGCDGWCDDEDKGRDWKWDDIEKVPYKLISQVKQELKLGSW